MWWLAGQRALLLPGDIADAEHCRRLVEDTAEQLGRLDILVSRLDEQPAQPAVYRIAVHLGAGFGLRHPRCGLRGAGFGYPRAQSVTAAMLWRMAPALRTRWAGPPRAMNPSSTG